MKKIHAVLALFLSVFLLHGCSSDADEALRVCPRAGILVDASQMLVFGRGESRTAENVAYDAELDNMNISCKYDDDIVKSEISFTIDMWAGDIAPAGSRTFRYFVAVTELNTAVVTKEYFTVKADFSKSRRVFVEEEIGGIEFSFEKLGRPDLYEILIGWDLTPEQLQYNRTTSAFDRPKIRRIPGQQ